MTINGVEPWHCPPFIPFVQYIQLELHQKPEPTKESCLARNHPPIAESDYLSSESSIVLSASVFLDTVSAVGKIKSSAKRSLRADLMGCELSPANLDPSGGGSGAFLDVPFPPVKVWLELRDPRPIHI